MSCDMSYCVSNLRRREDVTRKLDGFADVGFRMLKRECRERANIIDSD